MIRSSSRLTQLAKTRNRLNDLGEVISGHYHDFDGNHVRTVYLFEQGSAKNAKRIRIRNKINSAMR